MGKGNLYFILLTISALLLPFEMKAQENWHWIEKRISNVPYVALSSFREFYEFKDKGKIRKTSISGDSFEFHCFKGVLGSILLRPDSRELYYNKRLLWLSFPLKQADGNLYLSRVDLVKLFEPLFRPYAIEERKTIAGVLIDPGHGGADRGAITRGGLTEKTANLDTARRLREVLKARGIPAVMTRYENRTLSLKDRAKIAGKYPGYIFVSIHYNDGGHDSNGVEVYSMTPRFSPSTSSGWRFRRSDREGYRGNQHDLMNVLLAKEIHQAILKIDGHPLDRGLKRARFWVLRECPIPAVLVEGGFLSHRHEGEKIEQKAYRQKIAEAIAEGILSYKKTVNQTRPTETAKDTDPEVSNDERAKVTMQTGKSK